MSAPRRFVQGFVVEKVLQFMFVHLDRGPECLFGGYNVLGTISNLPIPRYPFSTGLINFDKLL